MRCAKAATVIRREDLLFRGGLCRFAHEVPFYTLLKQINEIHREGPGEEDEENQQLMQIGCLRNPVP